MPTTKAEGTPATSPQVSVVIPSGRGGSYLREAVASVLAQTFADFELIVVADGCPDDLADLAGSDPRIRIIRQERRGESVARNVGIRASRSDYICFLDDDDRMRPERIETQFAAMSADPGLAICHSQFVRIDAEGRDIGGGYSTDVGYDDLLAGSFDVLMPTTMMRKSSLQEIGLFDSSLKTCQDVDVILRLAREYKLCFQPEVLTEYRIHDGNASRDTRSVGKVLYDLIYKHLRLAERLGHDDHADAARRGLQNMRRFTSAGCMSDARRSWRERDLRRTGSRLVEAIRLSPREAMADLIANRRPVRALARWSHHMGRGRQAAAASPDR